MKNREKKLVTYAIFMCLLAIAMMPVVSSGSININGTFTPTGAASTFAAYDTQSFGGHIQVTGPNNPPTFANEAPTNTSINIDLTPKCYVVCNDADGGDTLTVDFYENSTGSYVWRDGWTTQSPGANLSFNFTQASSYSTKYWWRVFSNDGADNSSDTYEFTTKATPSTFTAYDTQSFGGHINILSNNPSITNTEPANGSSNVNLYPMLNITVDEPQNQNFNISWSTNATGDWIKYNASCTDGTYRQRATWANTSDTKYWWTVKVNDTDGNWVNETYSFTTTDTSWSDWSDWWQFTYTVAGAPDNLTAETQSSSSITLNWTIGNYTDKTTVVRNETGYTNYPDSPTNGTVIYNSTSDTYSDTGLTENTLYYYTAWSWNNTFSDHSYGNDTASNTTDISGDGISITSFSTPYSQRHTTSITASPVDWMNFSVDVVNITSVFLNITDAYSAVHSINITANNTGNTYWCNRTYPQSWGNGTYTAKIYGNSSTNQSESATITFTMYPTCDVNMNNWTTATDITQVTGGGNWGSNGANRFSVEDVNENGWVTATDISQIIAVGNWGAVTSP